MINRCPDCVALLKRRNISDNKCWKCGVTSISDAIEKEKNKLKA